MQANLPTSLVSHLNGCLSALMSDNTEPSFFFGGGGGPATYTDSFTKISIMVPQMLSMDLGKFFIFMAEL